MNKKNLIISLIILILILGGAYFSLTKQDQDTKAEGLERSQGEEIDTSDWETYESEELGIEFKYPNNQYNIIVEKKEFLYVVSLRNKIDNEQMVSFWYHMPESFVQHGIGFYDFHKYEKIDDVYYGVLDNVQKVEVDVLEKLDLKIGSSVIVDGQLLNKNMPLLGMNADFAAIVNLQNNKYEGVAILPSSTVDYNIFVSMLKSMQSL